MNAMRRKNRIQTPKIQASLLAGRLSLEWRQQPSQELQFPVPFASEWCHVITFLPVTTWLLIFTALLLWCCLITPVLHCLLLCHIIGWSPTKWQEETLWSLLCDDFHLSYSSKGWDDPRSSSSNWYKPSGAYQPLGQLRSKPIITCHFPRHKISDKPIRTLVGWGRHLSLEREQGSKQHQEATTWCSCLPWVKPDWE